MLKSIRRYLVTAWRLRFWPHSYEPLDFLKGIRSIKQQKLIAAPKRIFCFWTGSNELSANRQRGLSSLRSNSGVSIELINESNLRDWILPEHPLPEGYQYLSFVHRSDYLRSYFMYHYGGGYSDIKFCSNSWVSAFDRLNSSEKTGLGYPERSPHAVANLLTDTLIPKREIFFFNYEMKKKLFKYHREWCLYF